MYIYKHSAKASLTFNHQLDGKQKKISFILLGRYMDYFQQQCICETWVFWDLGFFASLEEMKFNEFYLLGEKLNLIRNFVPKVCLQSSKLQNIFSCSSNVINEDCLFLLHGWCLTSDTLHLIRLVTEISGSLHTYNQYQLCQAADSFFS